MFESLLHSRLLILCIGSLFLFASVFFQVNGKERWSISLLLGASFFIFLFATLLCPYLNLWDERFHALVAKNLMGHPLLPTLYDDPVVNMAYDRWDRFHIWVHKQPLFLWEIAVSYKIFGVNEFALRFPSALSACALVWAAYRSGKLLKNHNVGYYTALLITTSFCITELVAGSRGLDHNDLSFLAWISLSIWAWLEYRYSGSKWWIPAIGIFAGFAILCKWLVGLLVFLTWGICAVQENKLHFKKYFDLLAAVSITIAVALPWQLLIFRWYPAEAKSSYDYNLQHFLVPLDGHSGPWTYHFEMISGIYGSWAPWLLLPAFVIFYWRCPDKKAGRALLAGIAFVYLFFTLTATKMSSFTTVLVLPVFLSFGFLLEFLADGWQHVRVKDRTQKAVLFILLAVLVYSRVDLKNLDSAYALTGPENSCVQVLEQNRKIFRELKLPAHAVMFNVPGRHYVEAMFYTGIPAYNFIPTEEQYHDLKNKKRVIAIFAHTAGELPFYLRNDPTIILLNLPIGQCE